MELLRSLKTPVNRIGFTLLVAGTISLLISVFWFYQWRGSSYQGFWEYAFIQRTTKSWQFMAKAGAGAVIIGAWLAWLYQPTIGRLLSWIKGANS